NRSLRWWRRVLKKRDLLIFSDAQNARNGKNLPNLNVSGTRDFFGFLGQRGAIKRDHLRASTASPQWEDKWLVRLSRMAKRLREASFAKSSSDTAMCHWSQSDHDIFSNPFHNSPFTVFHAWRTCSRDGMAAWDLSGLETKATSNSGCNRSPSPNSGSIASCIAVRCPHK